MTFDKPFKTLDEQIELLKQRGLIINNIDNAKHYLITSSYYDLVNGFKDVYMPNDKFLNDISIEGLFLLSYIDKSVQSFIVKYSLMVETKFKNCLAYILSKNIGVHEDDYLHQKNFKKRANRNLTFQAVKNEINNRLNKDKAKQPTKHYLSIHNHVPPWILLKNISLGASINLFKCLKTADKFEFAQLFLPSDKIEPNQKIDLITNGMDTIREFRNCAAHNLNFVKCRIFPGVSGELLYKLLPKGAVRKYANTISKKDRNSLKGLYGVVLLMYIFLNDKFICMMLTHELISTLTNSHEIISKYYKSYQKLSNLPTDLATRINNLQKGFKTP